MTGVQTCALPILALGGIAATAPPGAVGVQGGQRPVEVARELGVRAVRGAGQDFGLDGAGRLRAHAGESARDDDRLGLVRVLVEEALLGAPASLWRPDW